MSLEESIVPDEESVEAAPEPIVELESNPSSCISSSEVVVDPEPVPVLASEPIFELESVPVPVPIELDDDDDVAIAGSANAATTRDVQINFFIKPPVF